MRKNVRRQACGDYQGIAPFGETQPGDASDEVGCARSLDGASTNGLQLPLYAFTPVETRLFSSLSSREALSKITTVVAPPGYGKTVLMSQLHRVFTQRGIECFWIYLDESTGSLNGLLSLLEVALGLERQERALVDTLRVADTIDRIETIRHTLARGARTRILFIDNINYCREPCVDLLIDALTFHTSPAIRLVVSSASGPVPFNASRARLELNLQSITAADLSFDRDATSELFLQAGITNIDCSTLEAVVKKTEGWPAAVRLLQLVSVEEKSLERGIDALSGDEAHISDILSRRLMSSFEPKLVTFLYEISELRHFSAELAEAMTGDERASFWIELLVHRNIMIVPVDRKRRWYRFHALFRQFLVSEAARNLSARRRKEVGGNAAKWLMNRGDHQGALELALSADELDLAKELLEKVACSLVREQGDTSTFIDWVRRARIAGANMGVQATFWHVWALVYERRYADAKAEVERASEQLNEVRGAPFADELRRKLELATIVIALHRDSPETVRQLADKWIRAHTDPEPFETATAAGALACSRFSSHEYVAARRDLITSQAAIVCANSEYGRCWVEVLAGMIEISQGNPLEAELHLRDVELRARKNIGPTASVASIVALVRAQALRDCGKFDDALNIVVDNLRRASETGVPDTTWLGIEVALPSAVRGDGPYTIADLRILVREYPKRLGLLFEMGLIYEMALEGRPEEALEHASNFGWSPRSGWSLELSNNATKMERSSINLAAIALFVASGHSVGAERLIREEMHEAQTTGRKLAQVELHLLNADLQIRSNARAAAVRAVSRAISIAANHHLYAPFLRRKALIRHVLEDFQSKELGLTRRSEIATLSEISKFLGIEPSVSRSGEQVGASTERATPREIELLSLLEAGLDNAQLAERLSLSVPTIKWHLSNLYCKLEVKNRSAAVAKGRALRLLQK